LFFYIGLTLNHLCWQDTFYLVIFIVLAFFRRWGTCLPYFFIIALAKCGAMKGKKRTPNFLSKNSSFFVVERFVVKKSPNKERDMDDDDDHWMNLVQDKSSKAVVTVVMATGGRPIKHVPSSHTQGKATRLVWLCSIGINVICYKLLNRTIDL